VRRLDVVGVDKGQNVRRRLPKEREEELEEEKGQKKLQEVRLGRRPTRQGRCRVRVRRLRQVALQEEGKITD